MSCFAKTVGAACRAEESSFKERLKFHSVPCFAQTVGAACRAEESSFKERVNLHSGPCFADTVGAACRAEEFMAPYLMFKKAGYEVKAVSIKGGKVPMDAASYSDDFVTDAVKEYQADCALLCINCKVLSGLLGTAADISCRILFNRKCSGVCFACSKGINSADGRRVV